MWNFVKWIGAGLGWFVGEWLGLNMGWSVGGPVGGLLGFVLGTVIDSFEILPFRRLSKNTMNDFSSHLLMLIAAVMKAERPVLKAKSDYAKHFLKQNFGEKEATKALIQLKEILKQNIPLNDACVQIRCHLDYSSRLQLTHFLHNLANAGRQQTVTEKKILDDITLGLGINTSNKQAVGTMFVKDGAILTAYGTLGLPRSANIIEIKKAFRHLANKYHPDKVEYSDNESKRIAQEKFLQLTSAYDLIKKERRFT